MTKKIESNMLEVKIPEGITFHIPLAGPVVRLCAAIFDVLLVLVLNGVIMGWLSVIKVVSNDLLGFVAIIAQFVINAGYGIATEWFLAGQTYGKKLFRIRVMDSSGLPLQFHQVLVRNLLRPIDQLPFFYLVGGISCIFSAHFQRLGDYVANTIVTSSYLIKHEENSSLPVSKYNTLMHIPHIASRIRQTITAEQANVATEALSRVTELDQQARIAVFKSISSTLKKQSQIPQDYIEGIPDETLVSNIVQVLYANRKENASKESL